ncbi:MAG TPA: hypothetical protein VNZ45_11920, partial [Bacteroidia bacterium]|nr:hypothetical protein [Bacteroidia bacterium]
MKNYHVFIFALLFLTIGTTHSQVTTVFTFNGTNGRIPYGGLTSAGPYLFGATNEGGKYDHGAIFKIKPDG